MQLDILLTATNTSGLYQAQGRDAHGNILGQHTFSHRPDLIATYYQLQALELGAVLGSADQQVASVLVANADAFGRDLHERLFTGQLGLAWLDLRKAAQAAGQPARLRLRVAENAPALETVPWEFLHDGEGFLAANRHVLLSRAAAGLADMDLPPAAAGPLRILVIVSQPLNLPDEQGFEPDDELAVIYEALDEPLRRGQIVVEVVDEASVAEMQRALIRQDFHVVHFIGHGDFDEQHGGYLVIEDEAGDATRLTGATFASLLAGRGVRLVLLSSCLTARASSTTAYRSVAGALLRQGLPAVVAMQYPIAVVAARTFYHTVYSALAANRPLDVAVAEGRQTLALQDQAAGRPLQWATPALFDRVVGGWRFGVDARGVAPPPPERQWLSLGEVQPMGRGFVGRQREQRQIRRAFLRDGARAVLIHGFGGMGKTVLAARVAQRLVEIGRFDGAVGLRARSGMAADEVLRDLNTFLLDCGIDNFAPVLAAPISLAQKVDALAQILRRLRVIVIFDNCEDWLEQRDSRHVIASPDLAMLLERLVASLERGSKLLLTSRYDFDLLPPGRLSGALLNVQLDELSRGDAVRLMDNLPALRDSVYATRLRVFQAVSGHPFVLNLFAERARRDGVEHVLADVRDVRREADVVGRLLLQQIVDGLTEATQHLLLRASVLRRPAPREALEALAGTHRIGPVLDELAGWGLLTSGQYEDELCAGPERHYATHALVREYCNPLLSKGQERQEALLALVQYYLQRAEETKYVSIDVFNRLEARHYAFQAAEYEHAGVIDQEVTEYLVRWGLLDTVRELNRQTATQATGQVRAAALHHWGIVEQRQGNYGEALRLYEESQKLAEALGDKASVASGLHQLGMLQQDQGNYDEALRLYEESRKLFEALGDKVGMARTMHNVGILHYLQGSYDEAERLYEESRKLFEAVDNKASVAGSLHQLGMLQQAQGNNSEAERLYEESRHLFEAVGDKASVANSLHQLGILRQAQGNYGEALRLYEESRKLAETLGDKANVARSLHQVGTLQQDQGNYGEALSLYEESRELAEAVGDKAGVAHTMHQLGMLQQAQGNYDEALRLYEESWKRAEALGDKASVARTMHQLGMLQQDQGNYDEALRLYEESRKLFEALGDKTDVAGSLHQIVMLQQAQGNYDEALRLSEESRKLFEAVGNKAGVARSLHNMGNLQYLRHNYGEALRLYEECRALFEALGDKSSLASGLHQLGMLQHDQGNHEEALRLYDESRKLAEAVGNKSGVATSLGQLGRLAQDQGRLEEAMSYYMRALALFQVLNSPFAQSVARYLDSVRMIVGEAQFSAWWQEVAGSPFGLPPAENIAGLSLKQATDWIVEKTIAVLTQDDSIQRSQWSQALNDLHDQIEVQPELADFAAFVDVVREWVESGQPAAVALASPFDTAWRWIEEGLGA